MNKIFIVVLIALASIVVKSVSENCKVNAKKVDDIAVLTIFSYDGKSECKNGINAYGHSFLSLKNNSNKVIDLYGYQLESGKTVFFSWWAVDKHMGIWFNLEPNYIKLYNRYETRYSVSIDINLDDIATLNTFLSENDYYSPLNNCSKMTLKCWNEVAEGNEKIKIKFLTTPNYVVSKIKTFDESKYVEEVSIDGKIGYINKNEFVTFRMEERYA